jgi:hypothetical protein
MDGQYRAILSRNKLFPGNHPGGIYILGIVMPDGQSRAIRVIILE